ncbi:retrovirus-related pol polyprotein from transposon TNT 1-94 [Tanacetum coccineum]
MCHIIGIESQFKSIIENGPFIPMIAGQRKLEGQWTADERKAANLDQRLKSLIMFVLSDDQMNYVLNCLTSKSTWDDLIMYHEGPSNVKENSPDDEEDTRSSQEYLNDLEEEYQARALLAKSKRFFKKGTQRFSSTKATNQTKCHKCGKKGHFAKDCWSKASVPSYQSPFQPKPLSSSQHQLELRPTKYFEARYNKVKAKLALLFQVLHLPKPQWLETKVKISIRKVHTLLEIKDNDDRKNYLDYLCIDLNYVEEQRNNLLSKHRNLVQKLNTCKEQLLDLKQAKLDFITMQHVNTEILNENKNLRKELKELTSITETWLNSSNKLNQFISEQIPTQKKRIMGVDQLTEDPSSSRQKDLVFVKSSGDDTKVSIPDVKRPWLSKAGATDYDSADKSSVSGTPLPPLEKLDGVEPVSRLKSIKSILKSKSTFKAEALKASQRFSDHLSDDYVNYPICDICGSYDHDTYGHNIHTTTNHNDIEWFKRGKALQTKKAEALKSNKAKTLNANRSKTPTKSRCLRHMTGVKSYLHKYVEQPGPKVVFGDDSTCTTEGYGSIKCDGIFDEKIGIVFNFNKEFLMIAPRVRDVYVLDMTSSAQESCFLSKASENLNWLWHKRLAHLNFKIINQLAKQNLVIGLPSLVYSNDKPCSSCEKGKHHKASFKTKQTSSIKKCLHLLHMDLFGPVNPRSINQEMYTLIIVDEYSRCPIFIHNHKDHLGKFDEKADDGYFLGYSLVSKAFRVFNTRRQQTKETYHITFDETPDAIKIIKPLVDNINIAKSKRYPPDEYLHPYEPSQSAASAHECLFVDFLSKKRPKKVSEALKHPRWVDAMQDELNQFAKNKVWILVPAPYGKIIIGSKWVFRNKRDETRIVIKNKARLIAQGYNQQEGIDYDETFGPVAILEAIRIFLAFATYMNFIVYQMDVKSAFLNGKLKEEIYVKQPLGFESSEFPNHVCKLDKALYGLKQAPRAWYETLLTFLTENKFVRALGWLLEEIHVTWAQLEKRRTRP